MTQREVKPFVVDLRKVICESLQDNDEPLPTTARQLSDRAKSLNTEPDVVAVFKKYKVHRIMSARGRENIVYENLVHCIKTLDEVPEQAIPAQPAPRHDSLAGVQQR